MGTPWRRGSQYEGAYLNFAVNGLPGPCTGNGPTNMKQEAIVGVMEGSQVKGV